MAPKAAGGSAAGGMLFTVRATTEVPVADLSEAEDSGWRELDRGLVAELVGKIKNGAGLGQEGLREQGQAHRRCPAGGEGGVGGGRAPLRGRPPSWLGRGRGPAQ
eukprot:15472266-Alexandrium_andersonii.AAC.1